MLRLSLIMSSLLFLLAACGGGAPVAQIGPDGLPLAQVYRISASDTAEIQFRMLDGINTLRQAASQPPVQLDAQLNAAAATHSRDMSVQNRPWHFGSDGSSPLERVRRVGFTGPLVGQNISETYEPELETLAAWMQQQDTRSVIMNPDARRIGFSWFQEPEGKIWWTLVVGG